jgi:carboxymethylenebutenolidase
MGTKVTLTAADGFRLNAYRADPAGPVRGGVVIIQEIFGVNHHIRSICDRLADAGYRAMAPQVFDRIEPDFESGYTEPEMTHARELMGKIDWAKMVLDASAAVDALKREGPVAIMGFCMGGSVAFLASTRLGGLAAAICYYGGRIVRDADSKPKCPVQMHFGEEDTHITMSDVETIRQKRPECEIHVYPGAGHAFSNEDRNSYELRSAKISWQRSLALLSRVFASAKSKSPLAAASAMARPVAAKPVTKTKTKSKAKRKPKIKRKAKPKPRKKPRPKLKPKAKRSKAKRKPLVKKARPKSKPKSRRR